MTVHALRNVAIIIVVQAATQLSIQALTKLDQLRTTLPRKTQVDVQVLHKLVCRPKWMVHTCIVPC